MRKTHHLFLALLIFLTSACEASSNSKKTGADNPSKNSVTEQVPAKKAERERGKVIPDEKVTADSSLSYSLYLPQNYRNDKIWPVLLLFDSHARGIEPVRRYQGLADIFEVVIAGSNNSRNGQQFDQSQRIYDAMIRDLRAKFNPDQQRIFVGGFSGGARVAGRLAQNRPEIFGVIGCGAGFQPGNNDRFTFIGLTGMEDFNYQEMRQLDELLDQTGVHHLFEYFTAGHEWPPFTFMAKGFQFLQIRAMAEGKSPKSDTLVEGMMKKFWEQDAQLQSNGTEYQWFLLRKKLIAYLDGLANLSLIKEEMAALSQSRGVAEEEKRLTMEMDHETAMRNQYVPQIGTKSIEDWQRIASMMRKAGTKGQGSDAWLNMRVLNFLSLNLYFQVDGALKAGDIAKAEHFLAIYALVDPPNSEHQYLLAVVRMRQNRPNEAIQALLQAEQLDFKDAERLENDPQFKTLHQQQAFVELLDKIRRKP